jgi:hypothetical protein
VKRRRRLLLAILVYVTLDLSLASMPGAFVFDAAQSVDSPYAGRGRDAAAIVVRAAVAGEACAPSPAPDVTRRAPAAAPDMPPDRATRPCLPRAALDPASPSEDPH